MSDKAGDVRSRLKATQAEVAAAKRRRAGSGCRACQPRSRAGERLASMYEQSRHQAESRRKQFVAQLQRAAALASQVEAGETQLAAVRSRRSASAAACWNWRPAKRD